MDCGLVMAEHNIDDSLDNNYYMSEQVGFLDTSEMDSRRSVAKRDTIDNIAAMVDAVFGNGVSDELKMKVAECTYKWFAIVKSEHSYRKHERVRVVQAVCLYMALKTTPEATRNLAEICEACKVEVEDVRRSINSVQEHMYNAGKNNADCKPLLANKKSAYDISGEVKRYIEKLKGALPIGIDTLHLVNKALAIEDIRKQNNEMTGSSQPFHRTLVVVFLACEAFGANLRPPSVCSAYGGKITAVTLKKHAVNIAKHMPAVMWINSHAREQFFKKYKTPIARSAPLGDITNTMANA